MPGKRLVLSQSLCLRTTMTKAMAISRTRKQIPRVSHEPDDEEPGIPPDEENPEGMLIPSGGLKDDPVVGTYEAGKTSQNYTLRS